MGYVRRRATELPAKKCCRGTSDLPRGQPNNLFSKSWFDPGGAAKSWFIPPQVLDSTCTPRPYLLVPYMTLATLGMGDGRSEETPDPVRRSPLASEIVNQWRGCLSHVADASHTICLRVSRRSGREKQPCVPEAPILLSASRIDNAKTHSFRWARRHRFRALCVPFPANA